jgi:hypothetical protein
MLRRPKPGGTREMTYGVDLYWLPLGAGGHSVRLNGLVYDALVAQLERRRRCDLYHSALEISVPDGRFVIEMTPVRAADGAERDVVATGAVGARWAGRFRLFRYEIRRWREGFIPDVAEAVDSPAAEGQRSRQRIACLRAGGDHQGVVGDPFAGTGDNGVLARLDAPERVPYELATAVVAHDLGDGYERASARSNASATVTGR